MLQQNILCQNKKHIFLTYTTSRYHTPSYISSVLCHYLLGRKHGLFWEIRSKMVVNGCWGKCSWSIYLQTLFFASFCRCKCKFRCWSSITFNFLKHNTYCAIEYVWSCDICEDFAQVIPFAVEDFITFSTDNLWRQVGVYLFQCICHSSFEFDTKGVRFTMT